MGRFSIGEALGAGFGLIARAPLSVLVWGVIYYGLNMLPLLLLMAFGGEAMFEAYRDIFAGAGSGADPAGSQSALEALNAASMQTQWVNGVSILTALLAVALVHTAIYRAVLDPQDKGMFYLRLGAAEGWQALVYACLYIMMIIAVFVLAIPLTIFIVAIAMSSAAAGGGFADGDFSAGAFGGMFLVFLTVGLLAFVGFLWLALRFSLAGPATYARRTFQLFESWTLTKGHSWSLFAMALLLGVILFVLSLLMWAVLLLVVGMAAGASGFDWAALGTFFDRPYAQVMTDLTPWLAGLFFLGAIATGVSTTILLAPFASAYRQIAGPHRQAEEF